MSSRLILRLFPLMAVFLFTGTSWAQRLGGGLEQVFEIGLDTDDNPGTGCSYEADGQMFDGIDLLLRVNVRIQGDAPWVDSVTALRCEAGQLDNVVFLDGGWPVGLNNGVSAGDVVESSGVSRE